MLLCKVDETSQHHQQMGGEQAQLNITRAQLHTDSQDITAELDPSTGLFYQNDRQVC